MFLGAFIHVTLNFLGWRSCVVVDPSDPVNDECWQFNFGSDYGDYQAHCASLPSDCAGTYLSSNTDSPCCVAQVNCAGSWSNNMCQTTSPLGDGYCQITNVYTITVNASNGGSTCPNAHNEENVESCSNYFLSNNAQSGDYGPVCCPTGSTSAANYNGNCCNSTTHGIIVATPATGPFAGDLYSVCCPSGTIGVDDTLTCCSTEIWADEEDGERSCCSTAQYDEHATETCCDAVGELFLCGSTL